MSKKNVYQFKRKRRPLPKLDAIPKRPTPKNEEDGFSITLPATIQGQEPGSVQEQRVAWALSKLDLRYTYQYEVFGGQSRRGGQVVDFMVYTVPLWTPVYVQGRYWHRPAKSAEDKLKQNELLQAMRGQIRPPVELWEEELDTVEMALEAIRRKVL